MPRMIGERGVGMAEPFDRPVARPLFLQIEDLIVERLTGGEWKPGEALPSEFDFAEHYNVSQGTVRKAIARMAADNLVVRFRGKGTFLASHTTERERSHFFHLYRDDGIKERPGTEPVSCRRCRANREMAVRLKLEPEAAVTVIERLRIIGGVARVFETIVVAERMFPGLDGLAGRTLPNELYPLYESRFGVRVMRADERLKAVAAGPREAEALAVAVGGPVLAIDRVAMTYGDVPVEWRLSHCNTAAHFYLSALR